MARPDLPAFAQCLVDTELAKFEDQRMLSNYPRRQRLVRSSGCIVRVCLRLHPANCRSIQREMAPEACWLVRLRGLERLLCARSVTPVLLNGSTVLRSRCLSAYPCRTLLKLSDTALTACLRIRLLHGRKCGIVAWKSWRSYRWRYRIRECAILSKRFMMQPSALGELPSILGEVLDTWLAGRPTSARHLMSEPSLPRKSTEICRKTDTCFSCFQPSTFPLHLSCSGDTYSSSSSTQASLNNNIIIAFIADH